MHRCISIVTLTVLLHNNGFVAVIQQFKRKRYCGYGGVVYKGDISDELGSLVLGSEEIGRTRCVRSAINCNLGVALENQ
jgi:hypothetical protein